MQTHPPAVLEASPGDISPEAREARIAHNHVSNLSGDGLKVTPSKQVLTSRPKMVNGDPCASLCGEMAVLPRRALTSLIYMTTSKLNGP